MAWYGWRGGAADRESAHSMQMRPCLSSASRRNLMSRKSEKYRGSKPVSASARPLDWHAAAVRNGIAFIGFLMPVAPIDRAGLRAACEAQTWCGGGQLMKNEILAQQPSAKSAWPAVAMDRRAYRQLRHG